MYFYRKGANQTSDPEESTDQQPSTQTQLQNQTTNQKSSRFAPVQVSQPTVRPTQVQHPPIKLKPTDLGLNFFLGDKKVWR